MINAILKARKPKTLDELVYTLKAALSKAADSQSKNFFIKHLTLLDGKGLSEGTTQADIDYVLGDVKKSFGTGLQTLAERPFMEGYINAYGEGKRKISADFSLNDRDVDAINVMKDYSSFWVRENTDQKIVDSLKSELNQAFEEGLTRKQLAQNMKSALKGWVEQSNVYWEVLADHMLTKVQSMGQVSGYEEAKIKYVKIIAKIDHKTTKICRHMHGRIIKVNDLLTQRDRIISAAKSRNKKKVMAAQPMINGNAKLPKKTSDIVKKNGIALHPYHFRCRTTSIAWFEDYTEYQVLDKEEKAIIDALEMDEALSAKEVK